MGWQDAPIVDGTPQKAAWESAPIVGGNAATMAPEVQAKTPGVFDKVVGAGDAALSVLSAIPATIGGQAAGVYRTLTGGQYGTQEGIQQGQQRAQQVASDLTYKPSTPVGQEYVQNLSNLIDKTKLAGLGPTESMALVGTAGPALRQVNQSVVAPVVNAVANSPEVVLAKGAVSAGGRALAKAMIPMPREEVLDLAKKATSIGIPLRPDMLYADNKLARIVGQALESVPLSGSKVHERHIAFNRALISEIGGDRNAVRLTPDVFKNAMDTSGSTIGDIAKRTPIPLNAETNAVLDAQVRAASLLPADIATPIIRRIDEIKSKALSNAVINANGDIGKVIPGETFRKINSEIGAQIRTTSNGDFRLALSKLQDDLQGLLTKNIANPEDLKALADARYKYAVGKTLIPLVAKSPVGDISPSGLMGAVTNTALKKEFMAKGGGDVGDLARIGQFFLKEPPSSNTAERALIYGGIGATLGGGAYISPIGAAGIYGGANAYNRIGPSISRGILSLAENPQEGMFAQILRSQQSR